jgi:hypothetical protein
MGRATGANQIFMELMVVAFKFSYCAIIAAGGALRLQGESLT